MTIGSNDGQAYFFKLVGGKFIQQENVYKHTASTSAVQDLCFSADSTIVYLGLRADGVSAWDPINNSSKETTFNSEFVFTVSCSPVDPTLFVVGGGDNTISKLSFYQYNGVNITSIQDLNSIDGKSISGSTFSHDGSHVYIVT